jgi:NAD(P)-dependent dehydrogenase (short-subunit alcohol dehydrogenase family)
LKSRVILVTGAGQGLGRVAALAFARQGATVVLHGRNVARLEAVYDEIETAGLSQPAILPLDFAKATQAEIDGLAQSIHTAFGRLDGIFHGASHFVSTMPLSLHDLDMWQLHTTVNLTVPAALVKSCLPMLTRSPDASVIFVTETHGWQPKAFWGPFSVSKNALAALVDIWTDETEALPNVRFNLCLPGPVASPMRARSHPGELPSANPDPGTLANCFSYLMCRDSAGLRGQLLVCQPSAATIP